MPATEKRKQLSALIRQAQNGDPEAMEQVLRWAHTPVSYNCRKFLKNVQDAEDMTQEILLLVYKQLNTVQKADAFEGWLKQVTAHRCYNALRGRHMELQPSEDENGHSVLDDLEELDEQQIPDKALDNAETTRMIEELVDKLPDAQRSCVLMYYYDELSVKEIASIMDVSENTVKSRLNYGRKAIKDGVLDYEKQGIKLYSLSPLPFLLFFLGRAAENSADSGVARIMARRAMEMGTAAGAGVSGAGAAAGAKLAASAGAAAHLASGISVKVVAGVLAGLLVVGGVAAGVAILSNHEDEPPASSSQFALDESDASSAGAEKDSGGQEDLSGLLPEDPGPVDSPYETVTAYDPDSMIQRTTMNTGLVNLEIYYEIPVFPETANGYREINTFYRERRDAFFQEDRLIPQLLQVVPAEGSAMEHYRYVTDASISLVNDRFVNVTQTNSNENPYNLSYDTDGLVFRTDTGEKVTAPELLGCTEAEFTSMLREELQNEGMLQDALLYDDVARYPLNVQEGYVWVGVSVVAYRDRYFVRIPKPIPTESAVKPASSLGGRADLLNDVAYYGDPGQCSMTPEQALTFAGVIEENLSVLDDKLTVMRQLSQTDGEALAYAALVDVGNGSPVLFFGIGIVRHDAWSDWTENIREDGCNWVDAAKVGVWQYINGEAVAFDPMIVELLGTSTEGNLLDAAWVDGGLFMGKSGFGTPYSGWIYPVQNGVISSNRQATQEPLYRSAQVGHRVGGGVGGQIFGMCPAADMLAALRAWAER